MENINLKEPFEMIFIDEKGKIDIIFKNQLNKTIEVDDEFININNHYDTIYYYIKLNHLADKDTLKKLREINNYVEYAKVLIEKNYIIINNITYYGIIKKENLDLLIIANENEKTKEQIKSIKVLKEILDKDTTSTLFSKINLKSNITNQKEIENYEELINELTHPVEEEKVGKKMW